MSPQTMELASSIWEMRKRGLSRYEVPGRLEMALPFCLGQSSVSGTREPKSSRSAEMESALGS